MPNLLRDGRRMVGAVVLTCGVLVPVAGLAQPAVRPGGAVPPQAGVAGVAAPPGMVMGFAVDTDANQTRELLYEILGKYPASVGQVLKLDPTLMVSEGYLASYPALAAFLQQHPDVARNPAFFLERVRMGERTADLDEASRRRRDIAEILAGVAAFFVFLVVTGTAVWAVRTVIEHRRWTKVSKTQFEVHARLLDRMTTNEELLAYIQTPVGRRFLESGPAPMSAEPHAVGAPFSRILWSVQVGIVLIAAGIGMVFLNQRVEPDFSIFLLVAGVLTLALGGGFIASGAAAYGMARRLGLLAEHHNGDRA